MFAASRVVPREANDNGIEVDVGWVQETGEELGQLLRAMIVSRVGDQLGAIILNVMDTEDDEEDEAFEEVTYHPSQSLLYADEGASRKQVIIDSSPHSLTILLDRTE